MAMEWLGMYGMRGLPGVERILRNAGYQRGLEEGDRTLPGHGNRLKGGRTDRSRSIEREW